MLPEIRQNPTTRVTKTRSSAQSATFKTRLRLCLGNGLYRVVTQAPRFVKYIVNPRYETEVASLPHYIKPGMVCFDIGACLGHYSRLLSPMVGTQGYVYAFEPSSVTFRFMRRAKRWLRLRNVTVEQCALSEKPGQLTLTTPIKEHGGLGVSLSHLGASRDRDGITETVRVRTLDDYVREKHITACDFIKCDVEGAELLVLRGGRATLARYHPILLMEIGSDYLARHGHTVTDVESMLRELGYRRFFVWENNALLEVDGLQNERTQVVRV